MAISNINTQLSIVVITLNEERNLPNLLADLARQTHQDFEVIVVDSASTDQTVHLANAASGSLPHLKVIEMSARGASLGRNTGANAAQSERILFLDADVRLGSNFIGELLWHADVAQVDVASCFMSTKHGNPVQRLGVAVFNTGLFSMQWTFPTAVGACILSSRKVHAAVGGFDESVTLCEDCAYVLAVHRHSDLSFQMLPISFYFNPRRLNQDGWFKTGLTYLRANVKRFFKGEVHGNPYGYQFGHYKNQPSR